MYIDHIYYSPPPPPFFSSKIAFTSHRQHHQNPPQRHPLLDLRSASLFLEAFDNNTRRSKGVIKETVFTFFLILLNIGDYLDEFHFSPDQPQARGRSADSKEALEKRLKSAQARHEVRVGDGEDLALLNRYVVSCSWRINVTIS